MGCGGIRSSADGELADVIVIGGGVIGLSIAWELSRRGAAVTLLEVGRLGRQASWAGAGILPPANRATALHPLEHLAGLSHELHPEWAGRLRAETGIDTGYWECGGLHLARTLGDVAGLAGAIEEFRLHAIPYEVLDRAELRARLPGLDPEREETWPRKGVWVPGESQLCNPHHLAALAAACRRNGVDIREEVGSIRLQGVPRGDVLGALVETDRGHCPGREICVAAGAWSAALLEQVGVPLPALPVRGQMVLYRVAPGVLSSVLYEGSRYLVPRRDGHVLAGATIEEAGFDARTTPAGLDGLMAFAESWVPQLTRECVVRSWAGLRPGTYDGFPYLGRCGAFANLWVATGHFKSGLQLSPGTAVAMADLIEGRTPPCPLDPFSPNRVGDSHSMEIKVTRLSGD